MKNVVKPGSRQTPKKCPVHSHRHHRPLRGAGNTLLRYCHYLFLLPALLGSCRKDPVPDLPADDTPVPAVDSVLTTVRLEAGGREVRTLDLFVYAADGIRGLEQHLHLDHLPDELCLRTPPGEKLLAAIANSPRGFNLKALERYDAMERLSFPFADDDPDTPILGGSGATQELTGTVSLQPLLCRVVLSAVCNTMDDYELLENPRVRLRDLPDAAEILRQQDFRPTELLDAGPWTALPCDVGFFPQEPGITLWSYPNDTPEDILGVPRPTLEFACEIRGKTCSFDIPLPPLARAATVETEITIDGPDDFRYKIR